MSFRGNLEDGVAAGGTTGGWMDTTNEEFQEEELEEEEQDKRKAPLCRTLVGTASQYCDNTTVHGFQYIVSGMNILEKIYWTIIVIVSFTLASIVLNGKAVAKVHEA